MDAQNRTGGTPAGGYIEATSEGKSRLKGRPGYGKLSHSHSSKVQWKCGRDPRQGVSIESLFFQL